MWRPCLEIEKREETNVRPAEKFRIFRYQQYYRKILCEYGRKEIYYDNLGIYLV